uniref:Sulfotransferase n=1 Tax=Oryza punctata TaxID=4537 RepID=A0A0E0LDP3_ORYPU
MSSSSTKPSPAQANQDADADDAETYKELYQRCTDMVSSWPSRQGLSYLQLFRHEKGWYNGITPFVGTMVADARFAARSSDIVVATLPKSGTTWIKALLYATMHRREHPAAAAADDDDHPFNSLGPHECVKFLEYQLYKADEAPDLDVLPDPRLFATHAPFELLPRAVVAAATSGCKVVYVCRDPKDNLVSLLQFVNKYNAQNGRELVAVDAAVGFFCDGVSPFGPYWEHVLGYWHAHLAHPERVLFFRYEEMKRDPAAHVRRLAEFVGIPFTSPEEDGGAVDAIVRLCSFDNMVGLEATKGGSTQLTTTNVPNSAFFRRGQVGDWANHLSPEMAQRIDAITVAKFAGSGLQVYTENKVPDLDNLPDPRLFTTHLPFKFLPRVVVSPAPAPRCKIVYGCHDPKDSQFMNKYIAGSSNGGGGERVFPVDATVDFCDGKIPSGPYWEHILIYWRVHQAAPEQMLFFRYEEMMLDLATHLRRLAEFTGVPFSSEEEDDGVVDAIVRLCSFDNMTGLEDRCHHRGLVCWFWSRLLSTEKTIFQSAN